MSIEQREAYWRYHSRKHEQRVESMKDYDELKRKATEYDALAAASRTEHERAVDDARAQARAEATADMGVRIARERVVARLMARGRAEEDATQVANDLNLSAYVTDRGDVDGEGITALIDRIAPKTSEPPRAPDMGQGRRTPTAASGVDAGREMFAARRKPQPSTT
jgi:hypothetical protein